MIALVTVSCGSDSPSSDNGGETPTGPSPNNINVSVDSAFVSRTAVVGSTLPAQVRVTQNGVPISSCRA